MELSCRAKTVASGLSAVLLGLLSTASGARAAGTIFVTNLPADTVGAYTIAGVTVRTSLIPGLTFPVQGIAVSGH
jgi:hypothetical protein